MSKTTTSSEVNVETLASDDRPNREGFSIAWRFWSAETGLFVGIWLILLLGGRSRMFRDPGTLWHPVVGARILSTGECLRTDPFSFTHAGEPWISQWWLGECFLATVHRLAGLDGLLMVTASFLACLYTWLFHRFVREGIHPLLAAFLVACAILSSSYHFHPRPHLFTIALVGWTFARLTDFEARRLRTAHLFWLVPAFIVWTNIHGGMIGGVAMLALCVAGWAIMKLVRRPTPLVSCRHLLILVVLVIACGITAWINPFGAELPRVWFALITSHTLPEVIEEHAPLRCSAGGWTVLLLGFLYVVALVSTLPRLPRVTWLIPLVWLGLAWTRIRHGPLFAVTATVALADILPEARWARCLARRGSVLFQIRPISDPMRTALDWRTSVGPATLLATAMVVQLANLTFPVFGRGWATLDQTHWPVELLPDLQEFAQEHPDGTPIFNDLDFGGFLIAFTPRLRVFIDDRCELYGDAGLIEYAQAVRQNPEQIDEWATKHDIHVALVRRGSNIDRYLGTTQNWRIVRRSEVAVLFERVEENRQAIKSLSDLKRTGDSH